MPDVIEFPGAGSVPAPGPRPAPVDLDGIGERYTALLEARAVGDWYKARLLEGACSDDVPALRDEVARVEALRVELAAQVDRLTAILGGGM